METQSVASSKKAKDLIVKGKKGFQKKATIESPPSSADSADSQDPHAADSDLLDQLLERKNAKAQTRARPTEDSRAVR